MQTRRRICRQALLTVTAVCLSVTSARAHPGSGIAVDKNGQVYFLDTGSGLWKIDTHGKLTKLSGTRYHWLALDTNNALANTRLPAGSDWDIVKVGSNPTVLLASDWPIAVGQNGNLYYPSGAPGGLQMKQTLPSGSTSIFATLPKTTTGSPLPHVNGITLGPDGSLYYTENSSIRRISPQGHISTVATVTALVGGPSIPGIEADSRPLLRGVEVDAKGVMYVAASGDGRVLKITPEGKVTTLLQSQSPWSPTSVALYGNDVYVLEFLHTTRDERSDWYPRISKIAADETKTILATVDQMPGARTSVPPRPHAVEGLRAVMQNSGDCRLDWKASSGGDKSPLEAVSHYRVERRTRKPAGQPTEDWGVWQATSTDTNASVKGLERGVAYEFRVVAVNAGGSSAPSNVVTAVVR
jgi:Fibronectin type III domain/SMP-30/Gluconolactonase/LRE-like region